MVADELTLDEQGAIATEFVTSLIAKFGITDAETNLVKHDDDILEVQVTGQELGMLIGPKGQTLQAVQELTRTVVQRRSVARTARIVVDIAGYRMRRKEALERFTRQVVEAVTSTGQQRGLEPMNAADRKVVHDTVNSLGGARTVSEGEDPHRRVVIIPDSSIAPAEGPGDAQPASVASAADEPAGSDI